MPLSVVNVLVAKKAALIVMEYVFVMEKLFHAVKETSVRNAAELTLMNTGTKHMALQRMNL